MFTGIVEELGKVTHVSQRGHNAVLAVEADKVVEDARIGDSIAVNGTCLTVVKIGPRSLTFDVMPETSRISNIGI
ncbi:MAG: riboflavin synthase, partial [Candidatus Omnitrophica bacterium]|nr:riboflavin synthase [Candidatus Omnitrophota bacterium]